MLPKHPTQPNAMANLIPHRISDFLKDYPPFREIGAKELLDLSLKVRVLFLHSREIIDLANEDWKGRCFVIREGSVAVFTAGGELSDQLETGDLFGDELLFGTSSSIRRYETLEDCLLYALPLNQLAEILRRNPLIAGFFPGNNKFAAPLFPDKKDPGGSFLEIQQASHSARLIACKAQTSISEAAKNMQEAGVGSILITDAEGLPTGIVTDKDLRKNVATGEISTTKPIESIMSQPVVCIPPDRTVADLQMLMIRHHIGHLCVTADGSDQSPALGIVSEHDILRMQTRNPAVLAKAIRRASSPETLAEIREQVDKLAAGYLAGEVSIAYVSRIVTLLNDMLLNRLLELTQADMEKEGKGKAPLGFCWLAIGSQGRGEQILRTDQDNALVYEDPESSQVENARQYFNLLAQKVVKGLETCGFEACPANMMASNSQWCMSLSDWKQQFSRWILHPTPEYILLSNIFFDFRAVAGKKDLSAQLSIHIREAIRQQTVFLSFLAHDALKNPPPLTFFKHFVLEKSEEHKDMFDIKQRAMLPLADAARLLHLGSFPEKILSNTVERFKQLADKEPQNRELFLQTAQAYEILMRFRNTAGLAQRNSGRYFSPAELTIIERMTLKNCFQFIRDIQQLINVRFQLSHFR